MVGNNTKSEFSERTETKSAPVSHSKFDLSYHNFLTTSYGEITPFFRMEGVPGDRITLRNSHKVRSYTLKSPLMSDVYMQKDYFSIPMEAILPINWNKVFTNPVVGDDVDAAQVNCIANPIYGQNDLSTDLASINSDFAGGSDAAGYNPARGFNKLFFHEKFFSKSSLFSQLGMNLWPSLISGKGVFNPDTDRIEFNGGDFDDYEDCIIRLFRKKVITDAGDYRSVTLKYYELDSSNQTGYTEQTVTYGSQYDGDVQYFEDMIDFMREHYLTSVVVNGLTGATPLAFTVMGNPSLGIHETAKPEDMPLNWAPIFAYQICCAHYFTNDRIDYIYSAELYRQMMRSFCSDYSTHTFRYNGVDTLYDELSGYWINQQLQMYVYGTELESLKSYYYFVNALSHQRSLRYADYFTSSRLHPLAVGSTDVEVNTNLVSVIDVTRNIQIQRFLNLVNKTGRKFEEYVSKMFGTYVKPDYHNPSYLSKTRDKVVSYEVDNTGAAQQSQPVSVTSTFQGTSSNFAFEFECDRPCIILGLLSYDIPRVYSRIVERENLHVDRFDYFNPFMQFIGDQDVKRVELSSTIPGQMEPWGYQSRYAEYKTRVPVCSGGFSKQNVLPSWQFVADSDYGKDIDLHITPSYIRSRRSELDKFFLRLTAEAPAMRFHFINDMYNDIEADRAMVANPNIL